MKKFACTLRKTILKSRELVLIIISIQIKTIIKKRLKLSLAIKVKKKFSLINWQRASGDQVLKGGEPCENVPT